MNVRYFKEYSRILDRDMEFKLYGSGGKPCFAFPPQNGRFFDFENYGMVDTIAPWVEEGRVMVVGVDAIDGETWSNAEADPRQRLELQERWFAYVTDELLPRVYELGAANVKAMTTGCSMGALHAANFFFRRPDLFDTVISLSGLFDANFFFGNYHDDLTYANSPLQFLPNMPADHPWLDLYRQSNIVICSGQGAWDEEMMAHERRLESILHVKGVPVWADYWGLDVCHDWPWWRKQLPYFFSNLPL